MRALLAYRADTCPSCNHQMSECHDPKTARSWEVLQHVCQPSLVAQVKAEEAQKDGKRGVMISTRRYLGG